MGELYLVFLLIAILLFAGIVAYSVVQKRKSDVPEKQDYVDPLFAELEDSKKSKNQSDSQSEKKTVVEGNSVADSVEQSQQLHKTSLDHVQASEGIASIAGVDSHGAENQSDTESKKQNDAADKAEVSGPPKVDSASSIVTELVARVKNPEPIEQQELLTMFRGHDFKFHRKVHIYGLNQLTDLWRDIEFELPSARFVELGVAIQLADRDGAMSKKELHDFQQMALEYSNKFDAPFEFSLDIDEALKQAQILDQIGRRYDSMAVLNVVPRAKTGFRMADIESCARDLMMATDKNGIFVKTKGQKHNLLSLYRLACTDGSGHFGISSGTMTPVHDLVIYMNVPATPEPDRVFQEMVKDANNLATWLDGKVVDRNGKVMTQRSYTILMQQISDIAYSMQQDGLIPGDAVSKKLF